MEACRFGQGQFMKHKRQGRGRLRPRLLVGRRLSSRGRGRPRPFHDWPCASVAGTISAIRIMGTCAPFGAPDSQHAIPTTLAHLTRPGTAPDTRRSLAVDNNVIYGEVTARLACAHGDGLDGPAGSSRHQ